MSTTSYRSFRLYGYPSFGLILILLFFLINPYERSIHSWRQFSFLDFIFVDVLLTMSYAALLFETGIQLTLRLNKKLPWERKIMTRFVVQFLLHISLVSITLIPIFQIELPSKFTADQLLFRQIIIFSFIFSLLATAVFAAEHFFHKWKDTQLETSIMRQNATQAQLDALKLQLDPHFLFNNLSTLASLIPDNPALSVDYVIKLSSIYRYMLANRPQNIISIKAELEFIHAYLFLYQTRYGEAIQVNLSNLEELSNKGIAPLTLQLLIENAIKHNSFSLESPLKIDIYAMENKWIVVRNNKSLKVSKEPGSQLGLKNIRERYLLLGDGIPVINTEEHYFEVKIPLLLTNKQ